MVIDILPVLCWLWHFQSNGSLIDFSRIHVSIYKPSTLTSTGSLGTGDFFLKPEALKTTRYAEIRSFFCVFRIFCVDRVYCTRVFDLFAIHEKNAVISSVRWGVPVCAEEKIDIISLWCDDDEEFTERLREGKEETISHDGNRAMKNSTKIKSPTQHQ